MTPLRRVSLSFAGSTFDEWTRVEITRSLDDISASFAVELRDAARSIASWPFATLAGLAGRIDLWGEVTVAIDREPVLVGWIDEIAPSVGDGQISVGIAGRDKTGDLVDCAATVDGPAEYRNVTVLEAAKRICKPFGITVKADVDVGDPFDRVAIDPGETAMSAIEKLARQRALIITSDGVGGLVLTRSGKERAAGTLSLPGNVVASSGSFRAAERFSLYVVKGQAEKAAGGRADTAPLDATAEPLTGDPSDRVSRQEARESAGVTISGRASDDEVGRYRPIVSLGRTQTDKGSAQKQADWMARVSRGRSESIEHVVPGFGMDGTLWRPNTLAFVDDAYQQVHRDMLIAGVVYAFDEDGPKTRLRLCGPDAYDLEPVGDRRQNHKGGKSSKGGGKSGGSGKALDRTAEALR